MLCQLSIRNIAVIERAEVTLGKGLNIITGETGAGKSIIIDSVNLILGERADRTMIRSGAENAYVEALFDISYCQKVRKTLFEMFDDNDVELVISREISTQGKNSCRINGRLATLQQLSQITKDLLDIHGQHEHQSLLNVSNHINVLDAFCGEPLKHELEDYQVQLKYFNSICNKIDMLKINEYEKQRRLEILNYQFEEIDKINPQVGEDEELKEKKDILVYAGKIIKAIDNAYNIFSGSDEPGVLNRLEGAKREMSSISGLKEEFAQITERIEQVSIECDDILRELSIMAPTEEFSQEDVDVIEDRISDINRLKRKYGSTIEEILEFKENIKSQTNDLEENEFAIEDLLKKRKDAYSGLLQISDKITERRNAEAAKLQINIVNQLAQLGMEKSKFEVVVKSKQNENEEIIFMNNGKDSVEFLIATNPGEPLKPLNKIASGGEMSRIMLALKTISSGTDEIATLIFDEIDTGISGNMSAVVAQKLAMISNKHQVICVTHTAQIAAMADVHNYIEKTIGNTQAFTEVRLLGKQERYKEISRLVGGNNISQYSDVHAKEILAWSESFKITLL